MAKYEVVKSFVSLTCCAGKGAEVELDAAMAKDLLKAGYVKAIEAEPAEAPKKKAPAKKKTTAKKG